MAELQCPPRQTLKEYLAGWMEPESSDQLESHLESCVACEQTIVDLEQDPETLLEPVRGAPEPRFDPASPLDDAIAGAKRLIHQDASRSKPSSRPFVPCDLGAYELLRPLGRGGMGAVFVGRHRQLGKEVALKLLPSFSAAREEVLARFHREIRAAGRLTHPAIVAATDAGQQDGTHFLVMELIDGLNLSQLARAVGDIGIADACEITRQAALGLSYAHSQGIVHRDVKPSNLMLDVKGHVKILDFGLAQVGVWDEASQELTTVGQLMGTLDYMSPEQAEQCGSTDYRADLYSLGATLFRLLCGRAPLAASPNQSPLEKLRLLANERPPRLDTLRDDAPPELVDVVGQLLAHRAEDRPASAAHVAEMLQPFCEGADLAGLLAEAQQAAPPEEMDPSVEEFLPRRVESKDVPATAQPALSAVLEPPRKWTRWLAAAVLPLAMFAGVMITIRTQQGELVIESEVDGVHVNVIKDGRIVDSVELKTGTNTTRIYAGSYEVVLDSPSDSVVIEDGVFKIASGGQTIARVVETTIESGLGIEISNVAETGASDPLFQGKTLTAWIDQLGRERSADGIGDALVALRSLSGERTRRRISDAVLEALPHLPLLAEYTVAGLGQPSFQSGERTSLTRLIENLVADCLIVSNPREAYGKQLATLFDSGDIRFQRILLGENWRTLSPDSQSRIEQPVPLKDLLPTLVWIEANLLTDSSADPYFVAEAARWCDDYLIASNYPGDGSLDASEVTPHIFSALQNADAIPMWYWREIYSPDYERYTLTVRQLMLEQAIEKLETSGGSVETIRAATILSKLLVLEDMPLAKDTQTRIVNALDQRIAAFAENPLAFTKRTEEPDEGGWYRNGTSLPGRWAELFTFEQVNRRQGYRGKIELLELIDLAEVVGTEDKRVDVASLLAAMKPDVEETLSALHEALGVEESLGDDLATRVQNVLPFWPLSVRSTLIGVEASPSSITMSRSEIGRGRGRRSILGIPPNRRGWNGFFDKLSSIDLLPFFIYIKAADIAGVPLEPGDGPKVVSVGSGNDASAVPSNVGRSGRASRGRATQRGRSGLAPSTRAGRRGGGFPPQGFEGQGFADESFADEGFADEGFADEGFADEGFADEGFADEGFADEGAAADSLGSMDPSYGGVEASETRELLYEGKSLTAWIEQFELDRSPRSIVGSLEALTAMADPETSSRITEAVTGQLERINLDTTITAGDVRRSVESAIIQTLERANPGRAYGTLIARLLNTSSPELSIRLLRINWYLTEPRSNLNMGSAQFRRWTRIDSDRVVPVLEWLRDNVFRPQQAATTSHDLQASAITWCLTFVTIQSVFDNPHPDGKLTEPIMKMLIESDALGDQFWLLRTAGGRYVAEFATEIAKRAMQTLADDGSSPTRILYAVDHLIRFVENDLPDDLLDLEELALVVTERFARLAGDDTPWLQRHKINEIYKPTLLAGELSLPKRLEAIFNFQGHQGHQGQGVSYNIAIELLHLLQKIDERGGLDKVAVQQSLLSMIDVSEAATSKIYRFLFATTTTGDNINPGDVRRVFNVTIDYATFRPTSAKTRTTGPNRDLVTNLPVDELPTRSPDDWTAFFIHVKILDLLDLPEPGAEAQVFPQ